MTAGPTAAAEALLINRIILRGPEMALLHAHLARVRGATRAHLTERFSPPAE